MITESQAITEARLAGATDSEIESEAKLQARQVGSVPFRNMIKALNLMTFFNSRDDWTRLAGALIARRRARRVAF